MGWVTADAPTTAELDSCVACGLCLPHCPTFRLTGDETASPRGRLAAMAAVADDLVPMDEVFEDVMEFCLQCRACEAVCPSLVPFGRAMEGARAEITVQRPSPARSLRHFVVGRLLGMRRLLRVLTILLAAAQRLGLPRLRLGRLPGSNGLRPLSFHPTSVAGKSYPAQRPRGTAALFSGCVMDAWFGDVHEATIGVLNRAGYDVVVPAEQTCCGALAAHDGAARRARALAARNAEALSGFDVIVTNAAGCGAHLKEYRHWAVGGDELGSRVRDVTEVVAHLLENGRLPHFAENRGDVAVQEPCHLRHAQRITREPKQILRAGGYNPIDIDPVGMCCGAAGAYGIRRPDTSAELAHKKADQVRSSGATMVASANPGCEIQLRSHLEAEYRIAHPVELYWDALNGAEAHSPLA